MARLTDDDLDYLQNPVLKGDGDRKYRERLREKIARQLEDFAVVNRHLRDRDLEQIFYGDLWNADVFDTDVSELTGNYTRQGAAPEYQGLPILGSKGVVEFIYRGLRKHGATPDQIYQLVFRDAVRDGEAKHLGVEPRNVRVHMEDNTFKADVVDGMSPLERWENSMPLSDDDVKALQELGTFEPND